MGGFPNGAQQPGPWIRGFLPIRRWLAFGVKERWSFSFSYKKRWVKKTIIVIQGQPSFKVINSDANVASMNIGATFAITERTSFIFNLGHGLTQDTPGFSLSARVPFSF